MKTNSKNFLFFTRKTGIIVVFSLLVFACSKNNDNPSNGGPKFCGTVRWSNTIGLSGVFQGATSLSQFHLSSVTTTEDGITKTFNYNVDTKGHLINDQPGTTYTYDNDNLVKLVMSGTDGTVTFTYDTKGHLTNTDIENNDGLNSLSLIFNYTYDTNDDPVKIMAHGVSTEISTGYVDLSNYDITADYLTDKPSFLPLIPEIVPYSVYFAYGFYSSKYLINKWEIKINGTFQTSAGVETIPTLNFTQQYTYTYDKDGRVATMVHTGNSKNKFTFNIEACN